MNHFVKASVATAVVLGTTLVASSAFAGIANTRHNLGTTGQGPNSTTGTGEICIFCHTPHGGSTDVNGVKVAVPLWNKALTTSTFTTYDQLGTSTLDAAVGAVGSVSLACLTCHDGSQAIDNIINAPGSGGYDRTGGGAGGLGWTWSSADNTLDGTGTFTGSVDDGAGNNNIWEIGTDLTNDHPVSMQYAGGGYSVNQLDAFGSTRDEDFAQAVAIGTAGRWYVDNTYSGTGQGTFDKWDFKLYTRDTTGWADNANNGAAFADAKEPFVECGSCHDPHFETTTFLRMDGGTDVAGDGTTDVAASNQSNRGSRVCLTCHTK